MKRLARSAQVAAGLLLVSACGTRGGLYTAELEPLPYLAASDALVQIVPQTARAVIVPPDGSAPRSVAISDGARAAFLSPTLDRVAVIGGTARAPLLDVVTLAGEAGADTRVVTLPLPGAFDALHFSPDGRVGVLTYASDSRSGLVARNLNEIAVVDLDAGTDPIRLQLETESLAPRQVLFAPPTEGSQRVAITFERGVAVFDALAPQRQARRINIRSRDDADTSSVLEALFSSDGRFLYLRASGIDDVIVIELGTDTEGELTASVNFVSGGVGLADIELPRGPGAENTVLALYAFSRELMLLDARGIEDNVLRLPLEASLTHLRTLADGSVLAFSPQSRTVAAWKPDSQISGVAVLDSPADPEVLVSETLRRAVFRHLGGTALSVISVEEAVNRLRVRIHALQLTVPGSAFALDRFEQTLFFTTRAEQGQQPALVRMPLASLALSQIDLDLQGDQVLHLPAAKAVALVHANNPWGEVTFLPEAGLDRTAGVRVIDTAIAGDLDRAFPEEEE